jgi:hypothetical protein
MADAGIKKLTIPKNQLPPVGDNNEYVVRYRVISEDKNRYSHWSPIFSATALEIEEVDGELIVSGNTSTVIWGDENARPKYDIFVKFDGGSYAYHGTSPIHTYSFINTGTTNVRAAIQVEGINKVRNAELTIFESSIVSLV